MMEGKVQSALRFLSRSTSGGVLKLDGLVPVSLSNGEVANRSTYDILREKHPQGKLPSPECMLNSSPDSSFHEIFFDNLNADSILRAALHPHGSAGPSGPHRQILCCHRKDTTLSTALSLAWSQQVYVAATMSQVDGRHVHCAAVACLAV